MGCKVLQAAAPKLALSLRMNERLDSHHPFCFIPLPMVTWTKDGEDDDGAADDAEGAVTYYGLPLNASEEEHARAEAEFKASVSKRWAGQQK